MAGMAGVHHIVWFFRLPEACAACHIGGDFFRSKSLFQLLPRAPLRLFFLAGLAVFAGRAGFDLSATAHSLTGRYRLPWRTASDPSSRCSMRTLAPPSSSRLSKFCARSVEGGHSRQPEHRGSLWPISRTGAPCPTDGQKPGLTGVGIPTHGSPDLDCRAFEKAVRIQPAS